MERLLMNGYTEPEFMEKVREIPGWENAVVAGGYVRDSLLGVPFKDIDIFVPAKNFGNFASKISSLQRHLLLDIVYEDWDDNEYKELSPNYLSKIDATFFPDKGSLDIDFVGYQLPDDEDFGEKLVSEFNLGIDRVYSDKDGLVITKEFYTDYYYSQATLLTSNPDNSMTHYNRSYKKFLRLQEKYPEFWFNTEKYKIVENPGWASMRVAYFAPLKRGWEEFEPEPKPWDNIDVGVAVGQPERINLNLAVILEHEAARLDANNIPEPQRINLAEVGGGLLQLNPIRDQMERWVQLAMRQPPAQQAVVNNVNGRWWIGGRQV